MELRHLRYFIAVADELNFSRAAARLQMAQPPLSQQIQALEAELGVKLFDRTKRPLQLTLAGITFLEEARAILTQLEQAVHKTQRIYQGELGYLTVGFTSSIANGILPNILQSFRQHYPQVKLILREENSAFQVQGLRDQQTDIIFVYQDQDLALAEASDLAVMPLTQEPLVVALPQSHRLSSQPNIALTDLACEEFIMPLRQVVSGLSEQIHYLCAQAGFVPKVAQEATFMVTILGLVAGEMGISLLPLSVQNLQRKGVVYRSIQEPTGMKPFSAIWRRNDSSAILQRFLNIVQAISENEIHFPTIG
ncbi:LysR family transcriptional regulator [Microcoleus sp. FACHB-1515]|uniref:LysR family transcriptional regulator n=1 Tax=Cyanophyceae TaxID=3028117 RepID=UPI001682F2AE|nr:LysR family transcriptional regulator [Microcoleus sp. FACHB-1515]MBD2088341.1 LysR family transcriptional regulator [Microcoleus sp. FACHB-1515]